MSLTGRKRTLLIALVGAAIAAGVGLYLAGMIGGDKAAPAKHSVEPISLAEPFIINLADADPPRFVKLGIAVQLEPMTEEDKLLFSGAGGGGHGGGDEVTGPARVAHYPKFRDAVIDVTSHFHSSELLTPKGKEQLKAELLEAFEHVAHEDAPKKPKKGEEPVHHDPAHPPFHVTDVYFQEFAVQ